MQVRAGGVAGETEFGDHLATAHALARHDADASGLEMLVERMAAVAEVERDVVAGGIAQRILRVRSEEHTSELQSLMRISYAVFCLQQKKTSTTYTSYHQ